ncbi:MAG: SRPBCC family protein [Geminicoccaceae bacterium]|nr:SRPBCC family protein [Geminicoccaceae bacterium]MDW8369062.1 SRPBCC family protein [Geminicoccaceae bacterium]
MPHVYVSGVVGASAEEVWSLVGPFDGLASWHPAFESSVITNGVPANLVGAERLLTLRDGGQIRERLLGFSAFKRTAVYTILSSPLPISEYVATLRVTPVTMGDGALVEWWSRFEAAPGDREAMTSLLRSVYEAGIGAIGQKLGG